MARRLGIPVRTWYNYEGGVTVPAEVVLKIIELTSVEPGWLLRGKGQKFRSAGRPERPDSPSQPTVMVGALLRTALQLLEGDAPPELGSATARFLESGRSLEFDGESSVRDDRSVPATRIDHDTLRADRSRGEREWLEARREGRCLTVPDDAMAPVLTTGASIAFASEGEAPTMLDGRMVVAWVDGSAIVRWFEDHGDHALLRAENDREQPVRLDLEGQDPAAIRRVLWVEVSR